MPAEDDRFLSHVPTLLGSATATLIVTFGLSDFGYAGTLAGATGGAFLIGGGSWWMERWYRRALAKARALKDARQRKGAPLTEHETQYIAAVVDEKHKRVDRSMGIPWRLAGFGAGAVLLIVIAVIAIIELGVGKPVSAIVQGKPASGLLVPVTPASSSPAPTESFTPPASPSPTATLTPSVSPSASPSVSQSSPAPSVSPTATTAPPSATPASTLPSP